MADEPRKHVMERILDNPWLLLVLGFLIPFVSYTLWGWIEIWSMKDAALP